MLNEKMKNMLKTPMALPVSAHYKNPRNVMDSKIWKIIKSEAKKRSGYKCELCNTEKKASQLHAHEMYEINIEKRIVTFFRVVSLCSLCHRIQHMGLAGIHIDEKKLSLKKIDNHISNILKIDENFDSLFHKFLSFYYNIEPWRRSKQFEQFEYIVKVNDFNEPLFTFWKEKEPDKFWSMAKNK